MKSIIKRSEEAETISYPCLKEFEGSLGSYIVLFTKPATGMIVFSNHPDFSMGEYLDDSFLENRFRLFNGTIELSNE